VEEKRIRAVVREEHWITEDEQKVILAYRQADASTKNVIKRILDTGEDDGDA
jgi:hypothetical protein